MDQWVIYDEVTPSDLTAATFTGLYHRFRITTVM